MEARDYYRGLYEAARTINSSLSLRQVLNTIAQSTTKAMGAKACSLRLLSAMRDRLEIEAAHGLSDAYVGKGPVEIRKSQIDAEALEGRTIIVHDASTDHRLQYPEEAAREGIASMIIAPISVRGTTIGVIRVYTAEPRDFTVDDVEFLQAIANLGGIAIENARVYETLEAQLSAIRREKIPWAENFRKPAWR